MIHFVDAKSKIILCEAIAEGVIVEKDTKSKANITRAAKEVFRAIK